jgi:acyl-CoA reductase-like NAD-dependent aldehyde dehydrogenase
MDLNLKHRPSPRRDGNDQVGQVEVNRPAAGLGRNVPFGGVKNSSSNTFREQGPNAVDFYTWSKTVYRRHE